MTNLIILKKNHILSQHFRNYLNKNKINIPENTKFIEINQFSKGNVNTRIYSFKNFENYLIKRLKINKNIQSKEKQVQARFYKYLIGVGENRKLKEISSFKFNSENKCQQAEFWDFYYPYFSNKVFFSRKSGNNINNNYPKIEDYIEDANGIRLTPISTAEYLEIKKAFGRKHYVGKPWTIKDSITSDISITDMIKECTVVGIIGRNGISLNHLNPNNSKNFDLSKIAKILKEQILNQGKNAKAFLLGAVEYDEKSNQQFLALKNILEQAQIPYSIYKTGDKIIKNIETLLPPIAELGKLVRNGQTTPFSFISGQHIVCTKNEIKIANMIIDKELINGNKNVLDMLKKSFSIFNNS